MLMKKQKKTLQPPCRFFMLRFIPKKNLLLLVIILAMLCYLFMTLKFCFVTSESYIMASKSCTRTSSFPLGQKPATTRLKEIFYQPIIKTLTSFPNRKPKAPPRPMLTCDVNKANLSLFIPNDHNSIASLLTGKSVLVLTESESQTVVSQIISMFESTRFDFEVEKTGGNLPLLIDNDRGRYSVIIFDSLKAYVNLNDEKRRKIDKYCRDFSVGMVLFVNSAKENGVEAKVVQGFPLAVRYNTELIDYTLNDNTDVWRITRPGKITREHLHNDKWTVFEYNHSAFEPLAFANSPPTKTFGNKKLVPLLKDNGYDGIRRVYFGNGLRFWLHGLVFVDVLSYLSHGKLSLSLDRYIQVDIDDIFKAETGLKMTDSDAVALVEAQEKFREFVEDFTFYLGFSGSFYQTGNPMEKAGDEKLIEYKNRFLWFGHTWRHTHAHELSQEELEQSMRLNHQFAREHGIPVKYTYSIAPWHDGVFPVHESLYDAWKNVWGINVTSTEEYPRRNPMRQRRGFIHKDIMVLPRQVCGVWTFTVFLDKYPGGRSRLDNNIKGGELFHTILTNPINIFMTHIQNYGNDRLALYTFESLFNFIKCWTNLKLKQISPYEAGKKYFEIFPEDKEPLWLNPCLNKRHFKMWSANKNCKKLPNLLVIGPQKTGTMALYTFLGIHPAITSSYRSPVTYEEVQFFNGDNYYKGLDWYLDFFPNATSDVVFEKSATYFHNVLVPRRAHALLPRAKIMCILIHPANRAYSWYQHRRAHADPVAMTYSFLEIIKAGDSAPSKLRQLRDECLTPGIYVEHLTRWLKHYHSTKLFIVDGEKLKSNPVVVMDDIQKFLHINPHLNYSTQIRFDSKKGFYCQITTNTTKCLHKGKGRLYPPMEEEAMEYLRTYYRHYNAQLSEFLNEHKYTVPGWLNRELQD